MTLPVPLVAVVAAVMAFGAVVAVNLQGAPTEAVATAPVQAVAGQLSPTPPSTTWPTSTIVPTTAPPVLLRIDTSDSLEVREWQSFLSEELGLEVTIDGVYGPQTAAATNEARVLLAGRATISIEESTPSSQPTLTISPEPACDPNYTGCVPVASDVDCAGGSGNGPEYVRGPVTVIGSDIYGLDRDRDGVGCE